MTNLLKLAPVWICVLLLPYSTLAQNTISINKKDKIEGLYQIEKTAPSKEYMFFDKAGNIVILNKGYRSKKALGAIQDCITNNNCADCQKTTYTIEKNKTIVFGFKKKFKGTPQFSEYRAKLNTNSTELTVKVSKTDKPVEVKVYFLK